MNTKVWTKAELRKFLLSNNLEITFERTDGYEVTIECTLDKEYIPEAQRIEQLSGVEQLSNGLKVDVYEGVISVFNLKTRGWQSFRVASVRDVVII